MRPLPRALVVAILGTAVLWLLGRLLYGLVGGPFDLGGAAIGAFFSTRWFARAPRYTFREALRPATGIVLTTLGAVALATGVEQVTVRRVELDYEMFGQLFWGLTLTSWWLIPGTAGVLALLGRMPPGSTSAR